MRSLLKSITRRINYYSRRQRWKDIFIFLSFVLLAAGFWMLQHLQREYEQTLSIPLRYRGVPSEWILSEHNPKSLHVTLRAKVTPLLYYR